jgi:hypothetical protein
MQAGLRMTDVRVSNNVLFTLFESVPSVSVAAAGGPAIIVTEGPTIRRPVIERSMTKHQIVMEVQEWRTSPNRAIELYKRGEPTFEVDATSKRRSRQVPKFSYINS